MLNLFGLVSSKVLSLHLNCVPGSYWQRNHRATRRASSRTVTTGFTSLQSPLSLVESALLLLLLLDLRSLLLFSLLLSDDDKRIHIVASSALLVQAVIIFGISHHRLCWYISFFGGV